MTTIIEVRNAIKAAVTAMAPPRTPVVWQDEAMPHGDLRISLSMLSVLSMGDRETIEGDPNLVTVKECLSTTMSAMLQVSVESISPNSKPGHSATEVVHRLRQTIRSQSIRNTLSAAGVDLGNYSPGALPNVFKPDAKDGRLIHRESFEVRIHFVLSTLAAAGRPIPTIEQVQLPPTLVFPP